MRILRGKGLSGCGDRMSQCMGLLLVCRLMLAAAVIIAGRSFFRQGSVSLSLLYVAAGILVLTMLYMYLVRRSYPTLPLLDLQIGADLVVVTWVVSISGRAESPFVLLYFVSIILAGYFLLFKGGLAAAAGASVGFAAASIGPSFVGNEAASRSDLLQCALNAGFFLLVGSLSGYLGRNTRVQELRLQRTQQELKKAQLDTDCIVNSMGSGLLTVDSGGRIAHFNPAAASILQLEARVVKGANLRAFDSLGLGSLAELIVATLEEGIEMPRREIEISRASGRRVPVGVSTSVIRGERDAVSGAVAVFQDLTEAREMEQKARGNETLAAIGELASAVAHEIRNCLSPISGSVEVLAGELNVDGENKKLLELIHRESKHLESFIGELLDFARVKPLALEEIDLAGLLSEAIEAVRRHPSFAHELSLELPSGDWGGYVNGDREQLRRAFLNLGINAVEATPNGGKINVKVEYHEPGVVGRDGLVTLLFQDTGTGIGPDQKKRVFEPFYTTKKKGSGLGLAVVKQVAERHGGRVSLESNEGVGTEVRLELPCRAVEVLHAA